MGCFSCLVLSCPKNLKTFFKNLGFSALVIVYKNVRYTAIVMPAMPSLHGMQYKNSSGDEIANVNFFTTISHTYFKIPKKKNLFRLTNYTIVRQVMRIKS